MTSADIEAKKESGNIELPPFEAAARTPTLEDFRKLIKDLPALEKLVADGKLKPEDFIGAADLVAEAVEGADEEISAELEAYQGRLIEFLTAEREKSESPAGRAERDIKLAVEIDKMAEGAREYKKEVLAGILERKQSGNFFGKTKKIDETGKEEWVSNLKTGDRLVSFLVPGADFLSIKYLNDNIFGPQITNKIIEKKREVLEAEIKKFDKNASLIQSDYKTEVVKLSKDSVIDNKKLGDITRAVDAEMTKFISEKIVDGLVGGERSALEPLIIKREENKFADSNERKLNDEAIKMHESRINKWDQFKRQLLGTDSSKGGFRMNYGVAVVNGEEATDKLLALNQSLQTSRMAREAQDGSYGAEYSEAKNLQEIENIKDLRNEIVGGGNKITDLDGNEFVIFLPVPVESAVTRYSLNRDLLRDVRKGKFKTKNTELLSKISLYVKKLNILDAVKPFISEEIGAVTSAVDRNQELAEKMKSGELAVEDRKRVVEILRANEKDEKYTSAAEFHKRAIEMNDAAYVSLDVLDLGVDLLLEYESALQDIEATDESDRARKFNEVSLSAGDETTKKLREFREKVAEVYRKFGLEDDLVVGDIGGDELTLAVNVGEGSVLSKKGKMDEFLFALKEATNTRVIKTVVSRAEKHVGSETSEQSKVEAHLEAIKRAEDGAAIAKDLEEGARKLTLLLKREGKDAVAQKLDGLSKVFMIEGNEVKSNFVIMDNDGGFKIANGDNGEFDYNSIKKDLDKILGR